MLSDLLKTHTTKTNYGSNLTIFHKLQMIYDQLTYIFFIHTN